MSQHTPPAEIADLLQENRSFPPSSEFHSQATVRDEDVYADGQVVNLQRTPNEHLAFGIGEHFCLGAGFARMELRVMFEELFTRFPNVQLNGPVERLRSTFIGGIKHLPVALNG